MQRLKPVHKEKELSGLEGGRDEGASTSTFIPTFAMWGNMATYAAWGNTAVLAINSISGRNLP